MDTRNRDDDIIILMLLVIPKESSIKRFTRIRSISRKIQFLRTHHQCKLDANQTNSFRIFSIGKGSDYDVTHTPAASSNRRRPMIGGGCFLYSAKHCLQRMFKEYLEKQEAASRPHPSIHGTIRRDGCRNAVLVKVKVVRCVICI